MIDYRLPKILMPLDTYERHFVVSNLLKERNIKSVLDVGGVGLLSKFLKGCRVTSINVDGTGDILYNGKDLPFRDSGWEAVVSLDTLEHIWPDERKDYCDELIRVAKKLVVLCAPLGTKEHIASEKEINELFRKKFGYGHKYLKEHIDRGLPCMSEIKNLLKGRNFYPIYSGDFRKSAKAFKRSVSFPSYFPKCAKGIFRIILRFPEMRIFNSIEFSKHPLKYTNRIYIVIEKGD